MRIFWVVNVELAQLKRAKGLEPKGSGGWLDITAEDVAETHDLVVLYPSRVEERFETGKIIFQSFVRITEKNLEESISSFKGILDFSKPDVVHIWGTENIHTYAMVEAAERAGQINKVVISLQGIVTYCKQQYMADVPYAIQKKPTFRDIIKRDSLRIQQDRLCSQGEYECMALHKAKHVIGRTNWDYMCAKSINENINYHYNAETLRNSFYQHTWDVDSCGKHQLFLSQGYYPLKGLHFVLEAMAMLKKKYPDIKLHVAGYDNAFKKGLKQTAYGKYIHTLIKKYELTNAVEYVGLLGEKDMLDEYLSAEVFLSASSIENSSNSIAEAMLLGMPVVTSNAGGSPDMVDDEVEGLVYQWNSSEMLAHSIDRVFQSRELRLKLSSNAREKAIIRHNRKDNSSELIKIYQMIQ